MEMVDKDLITTYYKNGQGYYRKVVFDIHKKAKKKSIEFPEKYKKILNRDEADAAFYDYDMQNIVYQKIVSEEEETNKKEKDGKTNN